jgi:hypothetical protein
MEINLRPGGLLKKYKEKPMEKTARPILQLKKSVGAEFRRRGVYRPPPMAARK